MNTTRNQIIALGVFLVAAAGLVFISYNYFRPDSAVSLNGERIEAVIHKKETRLKQILKQTHNALAEKSSSRSSFNQVIPYQEKSLREQGFSLFIYKNDSLVSWTNNKISVAQNLKQASYKERIVEYNNGWYLTAYLKDSTYQIGGTYLIKQEYPYTNQYLQNSFQKDLRITNGSDYRIEFVEISFGLPVKDADGNYLFSIIARDNQGASLLEEVIALVLLFIAALALLLAIKPWVGRNYLTILAGLLVLGGLRYLMMRYSFPDIIYRSGLFSSSALNSISWLRSTGDLLLNTLILVYLALLTYLKPNENFSSRLPASRAILLNLAGWLIVIALASGVQFVISQFLLHTNAPLSISQPLSLNLSTLWLFLILAGMLATLVLLVYKLFYHLKQFCHNLVSLFTGIMVYGIAITLLWTLPVADFMFKAGLTGVFVISILAAFYGIKPQLNDYHLIGLLFIAAVYLAFFVHITRQNKITASEKQIAQELKDRRDYMLEDILSKRIEAIRSDENLAQYVMRKKPGSSEQVDFIKEYLQKHYFLDYFNRFELIVTICGPPEDFIASNHTSNCLGYYNDRIKNYGQEIVLPHFYFLETPEGEAKYLGRFSFYDNDSTRYLLYVSLRSKLGRSEVGYPALLTDKNRARPRIGQNYSYARYENHRLVKKSGNYYYDNTDRAYDNIGQTYQYVQREGYVHLVYRPNSQDKVILSRPAFTFKTHGVVFSYIFLFLIVLTYAFLLIIRGRSIVRNINLNFKNRIKLAMLVVLILSFIFIGAGTIYFSRQQFEEKHKERIGEKIKSVSAQLEKEFAGTSSLETSLQLKTPESVDIFLMRYSKVFQIDINIYGLDGRLMGSSRPEIFRKKLLSNKIHPVALQHLKYENEARFIHNEQIGKLEYASAYVPIYNGNNRVVGYLNLPYFTQPQILEQEISNMLVTVLNIYVLLLIVTSAIAVLIANQATHPLYLLEQKFRAVRIGRRNEPIEYKGNDEIGRIVSAYNEMMSKLTESIEKLAETEREMAWREMARQIAHEIRNPLTPMKLSIQHLQKSWRNKPDKFANRFETVSQTLIEQIDTLSAIATEFSNFAKMPTPNMEAFNVISRLENVILLFENTEQDMQITFDNNNLERLDVLSDKEQIQRVFINIIKNGIQSIPDDRQGKIEVSVKNHSDTALITITDNGNGIPKDRREKLFRPSFTTKSGGMGMGLAIVKNIVEATDGKIWFETETGKGTTFYVQLPLAKEEDKQDEEKLP